MGVPPQGGGAFDAANLGFDVEEFDSPASADTVEKAASETPTGVETDLQTAHLFQRVVLDSVDYAGATKFPANSALLVDPNTGNIFAIWQAGATGSPTGIVASWSTDGGYTWTAPAQVGTFNDPWVPSAVIDPASGDIHVCIAKSGIPALDTADDVWYQVLPWTGSAWDLTLSAIQLLSGSSSTGYRNGSLAVDDNGFLVLAFMELELDNDVWIDILISNGPWDLTSFTFDDEFTVTTSLEARIKLVWGDDVMAKRWMILVEQNGIYRLYRAEDVLSASAHTLSFAQSQTYFESSTDEFDMVHMVLPGSGAVGIIQKNGNGVEFRSWSPTADTISSPTVIEGDASNPCRYPAVTVDGSEFIVMYTREVASDDHQIIYQRSENNGATWNVERHPLDEDAGGNHWGWLKLPPTTLTWDRLAVIWCDNALTPYDVHFGMAAILIERAVGEAVAGDDTIEDFGIPVAETPVATEAIVGGEAKGPVSDVGSAAEALSQERPLSEAAAAAEVLATESEVAESVEGVETFPGGQEIPVVETPSAAETIAQDNPLTVAEAASAAEAIPAVDQEIATVTETVVGTESFPDMEKAIIEAVQALETFLEAAPNLVASIYDDVSSHTSTLFRLDTAQWTEVSEQAGLAHVYQKLYQFKDAAEMGAILFRRRGPSNGRMNGPWSGLERSLDLGETWIEVLANCADVAFGSSGTGFAVATGGDVRSHRIYKSVDKGETWTLVYNDDPEGVAGEEPPLQLIAVDPADNDRVMVVGNRAGHDSWSQLDLRMLFTSDGFATAPTVRSNPIAGFWLFTHKRTLVGAASGRWVFTGRPDFLTSARHRIYTSDDDGATWDLRLDQLYTIVNEETHQILYEGSSRLFTVQRSNVNAVWTSTDNGTTWLPVDINDVESPDDSGVVLDTSGLLDARAIAYDRDEDRLFVGTNDTRFPVITQVAVQSGLVWDNLRANMVDVVGPGSTPAAALRCSEEGLIQVASLGEVQVAMQDVGSATEALDNLRSVLETVTSTDEIVEMTKEVLEDAAAADVLVIELPFAEASAGAETLTLVLTITDLASAAEVLTQTDEIWLSVRILLHEGIAHLRLEGPGHSAVPGR